MIDVDIESKPFRRHVIAATGAVLFLAVALLFLSSKEHYADEKLILSAKSSRALVSILSLAGVEGYVSLSLYVELALKVACSFKRWAHNNTDMVLLLVDEFHDLDPSYRSALEATGWTLLRVPCLPRHHRWSAFANRYSNTCMFSKLWLWALDMYHTVVYVDLDMLFVGDPRVDSLDCGGEPLAMVLDEGYTAALSYDYFNAGFVLLRPDKERFHRMLADIRGDIPELAEQDFLNEYFKGSIQGLPAVYNMHVGQPGLAQNSAAVLVHFIAENKPWRPDRCADPQIQPLCELWHRAPNTC